MSGVFRVFQPFVAAIGFYAGLSLFVASLVLMTVIPATTPIPRPSWYRYVGFPLVLSMGVGVSAAGFDALNRIVTGDRAGLPMFLGLLVALFVLPFVGLAIGRRLRSGRAGAAE